MLRILDWNDYAQRKADIAAQAENG